MADIDKLKEWYRLHRRREFLETYDKEKAWNNIQARISSHRRINLWKRWGSMAAVVIFLCGAAIWWSKSSNTPETSGEESTIVLAQKMSIHSAQESISNNGCTINVPKGAEYSKDMTDGTKVVLNAGAELKYPKNFKGSRREVELKGEAYFEVAHNESKPFVVNTPSGTIEVLGTQFNVDAQAEKTTVTLQEGSVRLHFEGREFMMKPGEQACMKKGGAIEIRQVNATNYTSWSTGEYEFTDIAMSEITHQLSLWYDVQIDITDNALAESRYTGVMMRNESLESALNMLTIISDIKVKYTDSKVEISKK